MYPSSRPIRSLPSPLLFVLPFLLIASCSNPARAFTFAFNNTASAPCETVEITWRGGEPPYKLLIIVSSFRVFGPRLSSSLSLFLWFGAHPSLLAHMADDIQRPIHLGYFCTDVSSTLRCVRPTLHHLCPLNLSLNNSKQFSLNLITHQRFRSQIQPGMAKPGRSTGSRTTQSVPSSQRVACASSPPRLLI